MWLRTISTRAWTALNRPIGRQKAPRLTRMQCRARDLMSIASLLLFCTAAWWLMAALSIWERNAFPVGSSSQTTAERVLSHMHMLPAGLDHPRTLALAWTLSLMASLAPLIGLRRLGKALYRETPLSAPVARQFTWLGHALVGNIVVGGGAGMLLTELIPDYQMTFGIGLWGSMIAALLAYVVAQLVQEGARAAQENRAFV